MIELVLEARPAVELVLSTESQPILRRADVEAARVEIFIGLANAEFGTMQKVGETLPGTTLEFEYNPLDDGDIRVYARSLALDDTPDVADPRDMINAILPINRTAAPSVTQLTNAAHTTATLSVVTNQFAKRMKVETSEVADFSVIVDTTEADIEPGNIAVPVTRTSAGSGALTVYTRVSISNGGSYGTPTVFNFTFANLAGSGGTTGSGSFPPGAIVPINHDEL